MLGLVVGLGLVLVLVLALGLMLVLVRVLVLVLVLVSASVCSAGVNGVGSAVGAYVGDGVDIVDLW